MNSKTADNEVLALCFVRVSAFIRVEENHTGSLGGSQGAETRPTKCLAGTPPDRINHSIGN